MPERDPVAGKFPQPVRFAATVLLTAVLAGTATCPTFAAPPPGASERLSKVVQVALTVRDLPRAVAFYRDTLGLAFMFETNGMAFFQAGDMRLMVGLARAGSIPIGGSVIYFNAAEWAATEAALLRRGVRFVHATEVVQRENGREHVLREFTDPDGNMLAIMGWRPQS
jgi:methylmalonyl-CoA/ethylmalonyl-CoA epimerase